MTVLLIIRLIKKKQYKYILYKISQCFPKPYDRGGGNIKAEIDLSNYAAKVDLKGVTGVDTLNLAPKSDLLSLRTKVDKIHIDSR